MKKNKTLGFLFLLMVSVNMILFPYLPTHIPSHWNFNGQIDQYSGRWFIFFPVALLVILKLIFESCRRFDPKKENYQRFQKSFEQLQIALFLFMFGMWIITLVACFHSQLINISAIMSIIISLILMYLGNIMPKIKSNYFIGIRTPWTIEHEEVWYHTHRFAGKLWFFGGGLSLFGIFIDSNIRFISMIVIFLIISFIPMVYSYYSYKHLEMHSHKE